MCREGIHQPLPYQFYNRPTVEVAKGLLGKYLIRDLGNELLIGRIVETEAYLGIDDAAAHSSIGRTKRTEILFGEPGRGYIYQLRGHHLLNAVTEGIGIPTCVLIRAAEPIQGIETMRQFRGFKITVDTQLMNGPGKLCKALQINMSHYGIDLTSTNSPLYLAEGGIYDFQIETSTRIGITKATDKPWRFMVKGNPFVSYARYQSGKK
jgi:DNA-3-methyladenine glycosylase